MHPLKHLSLQFGESGYFFRIFMLASWNSGFFRTYSRKKSWLADSSNSAPSLLGNRAHGPISKVRRQKQKLWACSWSPQVQSVMALSLQDLATPFFPEMRWSLKSMHCHHICAASQAMPPPLSLCSDLLATLEPGETQCKTNCGARHLQGTWH